MPIEETFRDWHHGWGVRTAVSGRPTEAMVERLIGVACLAYSLQLQLGQRLRWNPVEQRRRGQWTVSDRISWFWCGQRLFSAPGYDWQPWLATQWATLSRPQPLCLSQFPFRCSLRRLNPKMSTPQGSNLR
jgi:hypothetical protein